jgi:putative ABC transport system permease protein
MTALLKDIRFALRLLARNPGFALVAILTLGLAIGANTTVFSVVNSVLLKPLPFPEPDRLVSIYTRLPGHDHFGLAIPELTELRQHTSSFQNIGAYVISGSPVSGGAEPARVHTAYATAGLLPTIGVAPAMGRFMTEAEERHGPATTVSVMSDRLWRAAFAADPDILGKKISVDGQASIVIGVMPPGFSFPRADIDLWMPLGEDMNDPARDKLHDLQVVARLEPGVTLAQARADLDGYMAWSRQTYRPDQHPLSGPEHPVVAVSLADDMVSSARFSLWLLQGAVGFLLLIAAANIASLLLARADAREREIAVRAALGADRARIVRQLLTESLVLGALGGLVGLAVATWGVDLAVQLLPESAPRRGEIAMNGTVLVVAVGGALATSLLFGLLPALRAGRRDLHGALKDQGARSTATRARLRVRRALVIGEVALSVVLVVGCGLMARSFTRLQKVDLGFDPSHLMTLNIELPRPYYPSDTSARTFWRTLRERTSALPGVKEAALLNSPPFDPEPRYVPVKVPGRSGTDQPTLQVHIVRVTDRFPAAMGIRLLEGRDLEARDEGQAPSGILINQTLARTLWPGQSPIGRVVPIAFSWPFPFPVPPVVGVVDDIRQVDLVGPPVPQMFMPSHAAWGDERANRVLFLAVRSDGDPRAVLPGVRRIVADLDPRIAIADVHTMDDILWQELARPRFLTVLLAAFAGIALLLAAIGIFGVMAHAVGQRTREIGIRMAIGAPPALVRRMVLLDGMTLVAAGILLGLAAAVILNAALSRVLGGVLYQVNALDPWSFALVALVIAAVGGLACWIPASRATRIDPTLAMRHD